MRAMGLGHYFRDADQVHIDNNKALLGLTALAERVEKEHG